MRKSQRDWLWWRCQAMTIISTRYTPREIMMMMLFDIVWEYQHAFLHSRGSDVQWRYFFLSWTCLPFASWSSVHVRIRLHITWSLLLQLSVSEVSWWFMTVNYWFTVKLNFLRPFFRAIHNVRMLFLLITDSEVCIVTLEKYFRFRWQLVQSFLLLIIHVDFVESPMF